MVCAFEGLSNHFDMAFKRGGGLAIEGCSNFFCKLSKIHVFGMKRAVLVVKVVHGLSSLSVLRGFLLLGHRGCHRITPDTAGRQCRKQKCSGQKTGENIRHDFLFPKIFNHLFASRFTLAGAVPPKLLRAATEASTVNTLNTAGVMAL